MARKRIKCKSCGETYRNILPKEIDKGLQGSDCASSVRVVKGKTIIIGGYGSRLWDMSLLEVDNPAISPMDPVCDLCIQAWVNNKYAHVVKEFMDFKDRIEDLI